MKTLQRNLCAACEQNVREAKLTAKRVPSTEGYRCDWCGRTGVVRRIEIQYDKKSRPR